MLLSLPETLPSAVRPVWQPLVLNDATPGDCAAVARHLIIRRALRHLKVNDGAIKRGEVQRAYQARYV
jgi:hypothetical protein